MLLIFYLEYQKDVHGKKSVATSEQVWIVVTLL